MRGRVGRIRRKRSLFNLSLISAASTAVCKHVLFSKNQSQLVHCHSDMLRPVSVGLSRWHWRSVYLPGYRKGKKLSLRLCDRCLFYFRPRLNHASSVAQAGRGPLIFVSYSRGRRMITVLSTVASLDLSGVLNCNDAIEFLALRKMTCVCTKQTSCLRSFLSWHA